MNRLRQLRENADLSQREIAEKLFLHTTQYYRYESGKSDLPLQLAIRIARFYNVSIDYIAGISDQKSPGKTEAKNKDQIFAERVKRDYKEIYEEK